MRNTDHLIVSLAVFACLLFTGCQATSHHSAPQQQAPSAAPTATARRIPAHFTEPQDAKNLRPTLAPEEFTGKVRQAYQVAREIPATLTQLPCFCYCDTMGHKSLHSCYEDTHSAGCDVCVDSALLAAEMKRQGQSEAEIRMRLIAKYNAPAGH